VAELKFGIAAPGGGPGHRYWTLRCSAKRPELYVMGNSTGSFMHVSLHEAAEHWHVKVKREGRHVVVHRWAPVELAPGYTRGVEIVSHRVSAATGAPATRSGVAWYQPQGENVRVHFDLILEAAGANQESWPGRGAMGTSLMGRRPLAGGGTACVVARELEHSEQAFRIPAADPEAAKAQLREAVAKAESPWLTIVAEGEDGHLALVDGPVEAAAPPGAAAP
jgi:hypothetical protein